MRVRRAQARLCGRDARAPKASPPTAPAALWIPAFAGMTEVESASDRATIIHFNPTSMPTSH